MGAPRFPDSLLGALRQRKEMTIITGPQNARRATVIWVVVDEVGRVLVRSVRGTRGRWYRDLVADPRGAIDVGDGEVLVTALPEADEELVRACSQALAAKYAGNGSLASMLTEETLPTTLQLVPR